MATTITFGEITSTLGQVTTAQESKLKTTLDGLGENPSTGDMLRMQKEIQQWTIVTQVQSTITKELADTLKGIIQKAA